MANEEKENKGKENHRDNSEEEMVLVRILGKDIDGNKKITPGLRNIKGISWGIANAICTLLKIDKATRIRDLTEEQLKNVEETVRNPDGLPGFLKNRQNDFDSGEDTHIVGNDLDLKKDFDIKRLKKIKAYKGVRHTLHLPVRGQRTKSNFRNNRKKSGAVGVKKKK